MSKILSTTFSYIGNLAFYDGWNADYIYFQSLLDASTQYSEAENNRWRTDLASRVAQQAIRDAQAHKNMNQLDDASNIEEFMQLFSKIISFLEKAYQVEAAHEKAFFSNKYNKLINSFSKKEREKIPELQQCFTILENGQLQFEYEKFTTLINILQKGFENAKQVAKYEGKRLKQLDDAIKDMEQDKMNQLIGLSKKQSWNKSDERIKKHYNKFIKNIEVEYTSHGQMGKTYSNGKYAIRGGYRYKKFTKNKQTAERQLAAWAQEAVTQITKNKDLIEELTYIISSEYPENGDFSLLSGKVRQAIILNVVEYGRTHLKYVLNKRFNQQLIQQMIDDFNENSTDVFDTVQKFDLKGLSENFGQTVKQAALAKDVSEINQIHDATKLYEHCERLIKKTKELTDSDYEPYLIQALKETNASRGRTMYDEVQEIIQLIDEIKTLKEKIKKDVKASKKTEETIVKSYNVSSSSNTATVSVTVKNGEAHVDMEALNQFIVTTGIVKSSSSKRLETLLGTLIGRASKQLKENIIKSLNYANDHYLFDISEKELLDKINNELRTIDININGPSLSELIVSIEFETTSSGATKVILNGGKNNKNDVVVIQVNSSDAINKIKNTVSDLDQKKMIEQIENDVNAARAELAAAIQEVADTEISKIVHSKDSSQRYSKGAEYAYSNTENLARRYLEVDDEELSKKYQEVNIAHQRAINQAKEMLSQLKQQEEPEVPSIISDFSNSFRISNTVKSYNTLNTKLGFLGGSLGADLDTQLNTLGDIFNTAGLPSLDIDWLRSAILNCAPSTIVGETNKNLLESYLGAVAAFALFDESGEENQMISNLYETYFNNMENSSTTEKILHLYIVDGIYVPGSQVLLRTINTLKNEVIPQIENIPKVMHQGAGIIIINTATEQNSGIPNRPIKDNLFNPNPAAWTITGQNAQQHVKLKILFLAGLLDIVNSINKEMGNIQMPK